jgi:cytochrome oxidase Cu insertion factor (SCO1/SenC/PrrC family)
MLAKFGEQATKGWRWLTGPGVGRALGIALVLLALGPALWAATRIERALRLERASYEPRILEPLPDGYPRLALPVPEFRLVDQTGQAFDHTMMHGTPTILTFVFAHCQTVCPMLVDRARQAADVLGPGQVQVVLLTLDPWRDAPASLPGLAEQWRLQPPTRMLSGDPSEVEKVLDAFQVARERNVQNGDVNHPPLLYIVDGAGRIAYQFNDPSVDWIVEGVRRVTAERRLSRLTSELR